MKKCSSSFPGENSEPKRHAAFWSSSQGETFHDLRKVALRPICEDELVIHLGKSFRTSSMGTTRSASASWMPSSMAANVSSSSSSKIGAGSLGSILLTITCFTSVEAVDCFARIRTSTGVRILRCSGR